MYWFLIVAFVGLMVSMREQASWALPPAGEPWARHFREAEDEYGLPRNLLARVAQQESSYNPMARSHAGALGLMQIVPKWHPEADPLNPVHSIHYAGNYLRSLYNRFGSWTEALAAYNWGQGNLSRHGLHNAPEETRNYVMSITADLGIV